MKIFWTNLVALNWYSLEKKSPDIFFRNTLYRVSKLGEGSDDTCGPIIFHTECTNALTPAKA
jgi:hypothetical protein